jgi:hypothetical protein
VLKQHNAEIVEATNHLVQTVIPAFVQRLQAFFETIFIESLKYAHEPLATTTFLAFHHGG